MHISSDTQEYMQARHTQTGQIKPGHASSHLFGAISPALVDTVHMIVHLDAVLTTEHQHNSLHLSLHDAQDTKSPSASDSFLAHMHDGRHQYMMHSSCTCCTKICMYWIYSYRTCTHYYANVARGTLGVFLTLTYIRGSYWCQVNWRSCQAKKSSKGRQVVRCMHWAVGAWQSFMKLTFLTIFQYVLLHSKAVHFI